MKDNEIIFIDKSKDMSSFDVIRVLRKKLGVKKMGHAGTLDPLATGLLIIGIDKGTKKLKQYVGLDKTYVMEVLLGKKTDTGDLEGKVIEEKQVDKVSKEKIKNVLKSMEGELELPVPLYSAVKIKGKPLYKYARKGIEVEPPRRKTNIHYLKFLDLKKQGKRCILKVEMKCQKGTYARSVAEEIGSRLNLPATVENLRRTKIGDFNISQAQALDKFSSVKN
ncbi:tRNA pseudouridine(55) synthase TruB [Patescibacteria group bacterium AH-259-L05]|nr:tRNA pseudouridine(55) synthase TruB [Patescibacteria group bacterium AH-259-L05]